MHCVQGGIDPTTPKTTQPPPGLLSDMLATWEFQILGLSFFFVLFHFLEKTAALRGQNGEPLPGWMNRTLRFIFLVVWVGPFCLTVDRIFGFPVVTPLCALYALTFVSLEEIRGGRKSLSVRKWRLWDFVWNYFDIKILRTVELNPNRQYMIGVHPHSILPFGAMIGLGMERDGRATFNTLFPGVSWRSLAASFCFYIPLYRDMLLGAGVVDASRYSARRIMREGYSVVVVPGGATEALYTDPIEDVLVLRKRLGFIRLALQEGADIIPTFSFNENNTYSQLSTANPCVLWIKRKFQAIFGLSLPLFTNLIPRKVPIRIVVGAPIPVPMKMEDPSDDVVQGFLDKYIEQITALWTENAPKYNIVEKTVRVI